MIKISWVRFSLFESESLSVSAHFCIHPTSRSEATAPDAAFGLTAVTLYPPPSMPRVLR